MASWNIPALVNKISEDVPAIKALLIALFKWTDADTTDVPVGAKRLQDVAGGKQMQEYSGSAWGNVGKLMHDVDMLDGKHASTAQTADTIPVRDANGVIPGNVSGNAATATEASSLASGYTTPVANGGTGATTEAGARASLGADNASNINSGILDIAYGGTGSSTKNFVDLTENQNVGGTKTFSSEIKSTAVTPISTVMTGVSNADTTRGQRSCRDIGAIHDKGGKCFASVQAEANTDGSRSIYFLMKNRADNGWPMDLKLKELADGTVQTLAKTPPAAANDTQIATSEWVRTYCETTKKFLTSHQSLANYLTKTTNVSEMGRYIDMHYDNATSKYDYDVRFQINSQGTAAGGGVLQIVAASVKASQFEGPATAATFIPKGTRMLFQQSAAPTGWTKETGSGYNNTALRFVTGNIGNKTNGKAFTTCMAAGRGTTSVTQGGTISKTTAGGTVGNKALSVAMLAKHNHTASTSGDGNGIWTYHHVISASYAGSGVTVISDWGNGITISQTGSGSNHNHGFTGTEHGHTFTGSAHSHKLDLDINYIDCIIAAKA